MLKWAIELSEYKIKYQPRLSLKGQFMADFIAKLPKKQAHSIDRPGEQWWTLHVDRVSGSRVGLILQSPTGELMEQAIRLSFFAFNNEAEYEVVLAGLNLALVLAATKLEIRKYEAKDECMAHYLAMVESTGDENQVHKLRIQAARFTLINDQLYRWSFGGPHLKCLSELEVKYVLVKLHETLNPVTSPCPFALWGMDIVELLPIATAHKNFFLVATDYFNKWVEAEAYCHRMLQMTLPMGLYRRREASGDSWSHLH
ncbi:hypothetical protein AAG906_001638 [Vitis piasezkii]